VNPTSAFSVKTHNNRELRGTQIRRDDKCATLVIDIYAIYKLELTGC
jgi:hypothetical protein